MHFAIAAWFLSIKKQAQLSSIAVPMKWMTATSDISAHDASTPRLPVRATKCHPAVTAN